jgi:hypothetical protein
MRGTLPSALSFSFAAAVAALISLWQYRRLVRVLSEPEIPRRYWTWPATVINLLLASSAFTTAVWMLTTE